MPIYEYRCKKCDNCFEALVWTSQPDDVQCPCCNGTEVERLMSTFATCGVSDSGSKGSSSCTPSRGFS